jgi:diguanylate cyclase (GGDEF)-like protein
MELPSAASAPPTAAAESSPAPGAAKPRGLMSARTSGAAASPFRRRAESGDSAAEAESGGPAPGGAPITPPLTLGESARDPLTGFILADYLDESVARAVERASQTQEPCSLLFFQLDRSAEIRAQLGDEKMDNVIKEITSLINDFLKEGTDLPARSGDDGFAIILPRTSSRIACNLAEQIRFTVGNLTFPGLQENTTLSLGIAAYPEQAHGPQELLSYAREASQQTQEHGGNALRVYGAE